MTLPTSPPPLPRRPRRFPWRGLLALTALLVGARLFVLQPLRVTSGSMEPLLHGDPAGGDEIWTVRGWWRLAAPQRFDLVVFERADGEAPVQDAVVVKRVAALGGESIRIEGGELFVREEGGPERQVVKRRGDFLELLVPQWREPFDGGVLERFEPAAGAPVRVAGRALELDGSDESAACSVALAGEALRCDDGWLGANGVRVPGEDDAGDPHFAFDLAVEDATTCVVFECGLGGEELAFLVTQTAGRFQVEASVTAADTGVRRAHTGPASAVRLGKPQRFEFWSIDGRIGAAIDGAVAVDEAFAGSRNALVLGATLRHASLAIRRGRARLTGCELSRDVQWSSPQDARYARSDEPFEVPPGSFFVLGDASRQSIDSRHYGAIPRGQLLGRPLAIGAPSRRRCWLW